MKKILFIVLSSVLILSCKNKEHENNQLTLVIGFMPHIQFTPLYVGIEKGFFNQYGIDLKINYGFGQDSLGLLSSGKADIALSDSDQLIISHDKGMKLKSFFQYYQKYPTSIVTFKDIAEPGMLKNKKIGVPELYGTSYIGVKKFLHNYNLENDVELVRIGYTQITSLLSNKVDGVVCFYNNEPIQLRMKGYEINEWFVSDFSELVGASFITGEQQLSNKRNQLQNFSKALIKSINYTKENPENALDISYKIIGSLKEEERIFWLEVLKRTIDIIKGDEEIIGNMNYYKYSETISDLKTINLINNIFNPDEIIFRF